MSLYQHGMTLKALLEDPNLVNPPKLPTGGAKEEKKADDDMGFLFPGQGAFLGPNLWDKTYDDFKLEYMDLDEFLHENGMPLAQQEAQLAAQLAAAQENETQSPSSSPRNSQMGVTISTASPTKGEVMVDPLTFSPHKGQSPGSSPTHSSSSGPGSPKVEFMVSENDLSLAQVPEHWPDEFQRSHSNGTKSFDPRKRSFSLEELRPQPMIKKSRKVFVPDDLKDERYWCRRKKNNVAAKRSRDARRIKENQIALRAAFLEKQNSQLKEDNEKIRQEMKEMKKKMAKLEAMVGSSPNSGDMKQEEATSSSLS